MKSIVGALKLDKNNALRGACRLCGGSHVVAQMTEKKTVSVLEIRGKVIHAGPYDFIEETRISFEVNIEEFVKCAIARPTLADPEE